MFSGLNFAAIDDNLIVGSQPRSPSDVDRLKGEGVAFVLCLQEDRDPRSTGVNLPAVISRCSEVGIRHLRRQITDRDPRSLRAGLPEAVALLEAAVSAGKGRVYVHCTAGLERAPTTAAAYFLWFETANVAAAIEKVRSRRYCWINEGAIRGATQDLLSIGPGGEGQERRHAEYEPDDLDSEKMVQIQAGVRALQAAAAASL